MNYRQPILSIYEQLYSADGVRLKGHCEVTSADCRMSLHKHVSLYEHV